MRRWRWGSVALALATAACGFLPGPGHPGATDRVGPRFELGPIPTFGPDGAPAAGGTATFFQTRDGWCFESDGGGMCAGGGGPLPGEFTGVGGSASEDQTCINTVTGKQVERLRIRPGERDEFLLPPLAGSEAAPVNVFMACWTPPVPLDDIHAEDATR